MTKFNSDDLAITLMIAVRTKNNQKLQTMEKKCVIHEYIYLFFWVLVSSEWKAREKRAKKKLPVAVIHTHIVMQLYQSGSVSRSIKTECTSDLVFCVGYFDCALHNFTTIFIDWYLFSMRSIGDSCSLYFLSYFLVVRNCIKCTTSKTKSESKKFYK